MTSADTPTLKLALLVLGNSILCAYFVACAIAAWLKHRQQDTEHNDNTELHVALIKGVIALMLFATVVELML